MPTLQSDSVPLGHHSENKFDEQLLDQGRIAWPAHTSGALVRNVVASRCLVPHSPPSQANRWPPPPSITTPLMQGTEKPLNRAGRYPRGNRWRTHTPENRVAALHLSWGTFDRGPPLNLCQV